MRNISSLSRRDFLKSCSKGLAAISASPIITSCIRQERPNILWIISEDTSPDLSCYGNSLVKTPYLDQLASEGTRFTRAFSTSPVCSPSRSAFMTGMYQTSISAHQHRTRDKKSLPEPVQVLTEYFREAGYFTANVMTPATDVRGTGKTDWNFITERESFDGTDWNQRKSGQPFFAQVNLRLTHRVFERDKQNPIDPDKVDFPPFYPDHPLTRRDWADYLESLQILDNQVGRILKRLDEENLKHNTIVFYFGDHGRPHVWAKQWLYEGGIRVPLMVRWPGRIKEDQKDHSLVSLIDLGPTALQLSGIPIPDHMEGRFFLKRSGKVASQRDFIVAARDRCDETDDRIRCIRTKRFKYIRNFFPEKPYTQFNAYKRNQYPVVSLLHVLHEKGQLTEEQARFMAPCKPKEELYDVLNNPFEIQNLAENPRYKDHFLQMRRTLDEWIKTTRDCGEIPESKEEKEYWDLRMAAQYKKWMEAKGLKVTSTPDQHLDDWKRRLLTPKSE